jgi:cell division protein FtsQ
MPRIKSKKPRRGLFWAWLWQYWRVKLVLIALCCAGLSGWMYHRQHNIPAQLHAWALQTSAKAGFVVKNIYVTGRGRTEQQEVVKALGFQEGDPLFLYSLSELYARLHALPWVEGVTLRRQWPDTLHIALHEREPVALWQDGKQWYMIDKAGQVIKPFDAPLQTVSLLRVYGANAPRQVLDLLEVLHQHPSLAQSIRAAWWVSERRWNVYRADGLEIRLPEENARHAWAQLYQAHLSSNLLAQDVERIELRLPDRMVIKMKKGVERTLAQQQR